MRDLSQRWPLLPDAGLALLRTALGAVMIVHGLQKVFTFTLPGTAAFFTSVGLPLAEFLAPIAVGVEVLGGVALILGAGTRVVAVLIAGMMIGASATVHLGSGFFTSDGGWEYTAFLAAASLAVALTGAGALSVDRAIVARRAPAGAARSAAA